AAFRLAGAAKRGLARPLAPPESSEIGHPQRAHRQVRTRCIALGQGLGVTLARRRCVPVATCDQHHEAAPRQGREVHAWTAVTRLLATPKRVIDRGPTCCLAVCTCWPWLDARARPRGPRRSLP